MAPERILVIGAGVAGSVLAFHLAKHDFNVTVVERSRANQKLGQGIEIEEPALQVVKSMGILEQLQLAKTGELGFTLYDESYRSRGNIPMNSEFSPTGALELMRGDLTEVLYHAADEFDNVKYEFQTTVKSLVQNDEEVIVELQKRGDDEVRIEKFDLVVAADGARSRTRGMLMGNSLDCYKPVGAFVSYFSIPRGEDDWPNAKMCHFPNRRVMWLRPTRDDSKHTSVYLIHINDNVPELKEANAAGDRMKQKEGFAKLFSDCGWETERVIAGMMQADNFYSDELVQVKLPKWSQGRVALLGDSAWAPTPFTGQGNQLAIIGGWVLAQELSRNRNVTAFARYEERLREYVEQSQQIPLGGRAPRLACPETRFGIWVFRTCFRIFAWFVRIFVSTKSTTSSAAQSNSPCEFDLQMEGTSKE